MSYTFEDPATPSLADILHRVSEDLELAAGRRRTIASRLRQLPKWDAKARKLLKPLPPEKIPFSEVSFEALMRRLSPVVLDISAKTLSNTQADGRFILGRYGLSRRRQWAILSPQWQALFDLVEDRFLRIQVKRLLLFLSHKQIEPRAVTQEMVPEFIASVEEDVRVDDVLLAVRRALRAWRKLVFAYRQEWPQVVLHMPRRRVIWGKRWSVMATLEAVVDDFLAPRLPARLFKGRRKRKLAASTVRTQKEAIRCFASALINDGVPAESLDGLRSICAPDPFERGIGLLEARAGGVTHWVEKVARVLLKMAKYGGVLSEAEVQRVKDLYTEVADVYADWKERRPDRDQHFLDELDDARLMDALLALPTLTFQRVQALGPLTPRRAYAVQRAVLLELSLCSALRNVNLLSLQTRHLRQLIIDGIKWTVLGVPADETKNKEATEHFLPEDVALMLDFYIESCLPLIAGGPTEWLFPGKKGGPKHQQTFRMQMKPYVQGHLKLAGYHPHLIRKVVAKITLDEDPTAIEVVRRTGGWKTDKTLRRVYLQKRNRASQARYVELLQGRRLRAFGRGSNRRKKRGP